MKHNHPCVRPAFHWLCCLLLAPLFTSQHPVDAQAVGAQAAPVAIRAVGDGKTVNTAAIQAAIDTLSAQGGGTLTFPAGRFVTGTIQFKDNVTLHLDENCVLLGSINPADYRNIDEFMAGDGIKLGHALIVADGAKNVGISGKGTIDGRGAAVKDAQKEWTVRPMLIRWLRSTGVAVKDVHLTNPGAWTLNFFQCRDIAVERVTIRTRTTGLRNNDGIDLDSCQNARIADCDVESGDDALCFKSTSPVVCRDITVKNCKLSTSCNGIKLGTESLGGFENISVTDCRVSNTGMAGIALYAVDGGHLQNVTIERVSMDKVTVPISIRLGSRLKTFRPLDTPKTTGILRNITLRDITATGSGFIGILANGVPEHPLEDILFENITLKVRGGGTADDAKKKIAEREAAYPEMSMFGRVLPTYGIYLRHARGIRLKNLTITPTEPDARPEMIFIDAETSIHPMLP